MKRIALIGLACVLCFSTMRAEEPSWQENPNSISFNGGAISGFFVFKSLFGWIPIAAGHSRTTHYYGNYGIQYYHQMKRWCRLGIRGTWEGDDYDIYTSTKDDAVRKGITTNHTAALMASVQFTYINCEHVQLYSGLDLGIGTYIKDTRYEAGFDDGNGNSHPIDAYWLPAFNITPIGVAFGSWRVYGFVETNVGVEAFAKAGIGFHI